jgi:S-DNA-T family DNA segregation ATPase FtsK/SpoIIIE
VLLETKLQDFSVEGRVIQVHTGPIVTMYEYEPAPGVKISRVAALADDLALSLKARSVRISAIPGKAALGIEIPNRNRETVSLREILASETFKRSASKLTVALGKDIFGVPVAADLSRMPHLLVAGSTGSGKSVLLNAMVTSLLYKAKPDEVKMLMIDPKLLELSSYDGIPHLISPVVTNPKEAAEMLRKMVYEMERRYRLIAQKGVRNIESFNAEAGTEEKLPYIVIFIDELADLMFAAASNVEDSIARLAQMARASGMHLVLATQRPSVDVITGVIKANFPARIAFHVTSKIDSRTILDATGAEQLIGKGDMLFMLPGKSMKRVHGSLVTEGEVKAVTEFVKAQGNPDFSIMQNIETQVAQHEADASDAEERDELYGQVVGYAQAIGEVSISSIQRKFKVGYNRAARVMELLEEDGRVGPPRGAGKPRDFLG